MADISFRELVRASTKLNVSEDEKTLKMNGKGTVTFSTASALVMITTAQESHEYKSSRGVIVAPHGAKILPYYQVGDEWRVVMVEQFRIALPGTTLEPAGGEVDETHPQASMARELEEEARITVRPEEIQLVFGAFIQPSMMNAKAFGGIVRIDASRLPTQLIGGEWQWGEYTVVTTHPLISLLQARDRGELVVDLETYMLLDAVAKKVGYLEQHY